MTKHQQLHYSKENVISEQSTTPLVSVVVPAYNAEGYITETLKSVLSQTYQNLEVLVVDDGSQDKTPEIVRSLTAQDCRVKLIQQANSGVSAARNLAITHAKGEFIAPVDADDIWFPQKLEKQVKCMLEGGEKVGLVYAWSLYIDENDSIIWGYSGFKFFNSVEGNILMPLVFRNLLSNGSSPLVRRTCFEAVGSYNKMVEPCEDWDMYLRIADRYEFRVVSEFLIGYRQYTNSHSANTKAMESSYRLMIEGVRQRSPFIPESIHCWSKSCFYTYIALKSCFICDYLSTLKYLSQAIKADLFLLLNPCIYRLLVRCSIEGLLKISLLLILRRPKLWLQLKSVIRKKTQNNSRNLEDVLKETEQVSYSFWRFYDRLLVRRWTMLIDMQSKSAMPSN